MPDCSRITAEIDGLKNTRNIYQELRKGKSGNWDYLIAQVDAQIATKEPRIRQLYWLDLLADGPIRRKWIALGRELGPLGKCVVGERDDAGGIARFGTFDRGAIYWDVTRPEAFALWGPGLSKWRALGGFLGLLLGPALADPVAVPDGTNRQAFARGLIVVRAGLAYALGAEIAGRWNSRGTAAVIGYPTSDQFDDGPAKIARFQARNGMIVHLYGRGTFVLYGPIADAWGRLGGIGGVAGAPASRFRLCTGPSHTRSCTR
jgi:uncharacterized protein with LGFP repeats